MTKMTVMMMICVQITCVYNPTSTQDWVIMVDFVIINVEYLVLTGKELTVDDKETHKVVKLLVTQDGRNTAKVIKMCLKWAIKVSHKIRRILRFGTKRTVDEVFKSWKAQRRFTQCVGSVSQA